VVQLLPDLQGGGVERGTLECSEALVKAGHESIVVSAGGAMVAELESAGGHHITWDLGRKSPFSLLQVRPFRRWLTEVAPDILHVRSRMPAWIAYLAWRGMPPATRPRFVSTLHGLHSVSPYSAIMSKGERVIAVSDTAKQYLLQNYTISDDIITRIYRGVSPEKFPWQYQASPEWISQWQQTYPQLQKQFVICLPGRLTRLKGHHHLLKIIKLLVEEGHCVAALIVGGEDPKRQQYAKEIRQQTIDLGLKDHIIFTGARSDILDIYSVSDVILSLSTRPESFGRTALEALAIGKPVIGYSHGGVGEILSTLFPEGKVENNNFLAVTNKLRERLKGVDTSLPIQNNVFLLENMTSQTMGLYEEMLDS